MGFSLAWQNAGLFALATMGPIKLVECPSGNVRGVLLGHQGMVHMVGFFDDKTTLASAGNDTTVRVWDVAAGAELFALRGHTAPVHAVRPCGGATALQGSLVSVSEDQTVAVWDVAARALSRRWVASQQKLGALSVAPNGRAFFVGGDDCTPRCWDLETLERRFTLLSHTRRVTVAEHSRDGRVWATGGADRTIRVWRDAGGEWTEWCALTGLRDVVSAVAFSPDGALVAAGSFGAVIVWCLSTRTVRLRLAGPPAWVRKLWFDRGGAGLVAEGDGLEAESDLPGAQWAFDVSSGAERAPSGGGAENALRAQAANGGYEVEARLNKVLVYRLRAGGRVPGEGPIACYHANVGVSVVCRRGACVVVGKADGEVMHLYAPFLDARAPPPA